MSSETEQDRVIDRREASLITRREAIRRVTAVLGGIALVGGDALLTGCRDERAGDAAQFSAEDIAFLDEVAETILPQTSTPGAKAAGVGAFMALLVADTYGEREQRVFRDGMRKLDERCRQTHGASFMEATPQQRLALLEEVDREQVEYTEARKEPRRRRSSGGRAETADSAQGDAHLPDQRQENVPTGEGEANPATAITDDAPAHYFRMMKELALLGYFTSEIGYNQAMRYVESPGRFEACVPYVPGERSWAPHA